MDEAGKFASEVLAPLNMQGDLQGCRCKDGVVTAADGFKAAYQLFVETGWNARPVLWNMAGRDSPPR